MTALSELLRDAKADAGGVDEAVRRARAEGHTINRATVFRYLSGDVAQAPEEETLQALAVGFRLNIRQLREAANLPRGELGEWEPPDESARLNHEQRDALDQLIRAIVRGGGRGVEGPAAMNEGDALNRTSPVEDNGGEVSAESSGPGKNSPSTRGSAIGPRSSKRPRARRPTER